jgi:hypothetical protein
MTTFEKVSTSRYCSDLRMFVKNDFMFSNGESIAKSWKVQGEQKVEKQASRMVKLN